MTPLRWSVRVLGGAMLFVAALWVTAPARATPINDVGMCAVYSKVSGAAADIQRMYIDDLLVLANYDRLRVGLALGYAQGYLRAMSRVTGESELVLATEVFYKECPIEKI